jgi:hypothetical protein
VAREAEVLGGDLPQCHFVYHKSHKNWPGIEPWPLQWEAGDKLLQLWYGDSVREREREKEREEKMVKVSL